MVETRVILEHEVQEILQVIDKKQNFLLSGGAGSGKTYSLVQVIKQVINENPTSKVACMTYTNAAVKEIEERVNDKHLNVSTIHDFLWDNIKHFQKELKKSLVDLTNDEDVSRVTIEGENQIGYDYYNDLTKGIQYKEYLKLKEGIISHDQVLILAKYLFQNYPKLSDIIKDKYKFIFIDEYQDTQESVVEIFLDHLKQSTKENIIGFFGDSMQSIYDDGIGDLDNYIGIEEGQVKEVQKEQNRRNPKLVIELANKIRTDGLVQKSSTDLNAPNIDKEGNLIDGTVQFFHSDDGDIEKARNALGWDFNNAKETKELNLTHNLIADKADFRLLMNIYDGDKILDYKKRIKKYIKDNNVQDDFSEKTFGEVINSLKVGLTGRELNKVLPTAGMQLFIDNDQLLFDEAKEYNYNLFSKIYIDKDQLLDDKKQDEDDENKKGSKRDFLIQHLFKIQTNIHLYLSKRFNEFLRVTDYRDKLINIDGKRLLKQRIEELVIVGDKTIEEIISLADLSGICIIDDKLERFKSEKEYVYNRVKKVKFTEFQKLYNYLEGFTPFSTQHKTKGTEFNNVFIILSNGGWRNYNFEALFTDEAKDSVLNRSKKIFYVCCTRAKENLAVYYHDPSDDVITKATDWFGADNVIDLDSIKM